VSSPYVGQLLLVGYNFAPVGWQLCNGQLMQISQYDALFALIGTTYGGDGVSTFALPDLRSRVPVHQGSGYTMGQTGGVENVAINASTFPTHTHPLAESNSSSGPSSNPTSQAVGAFELYVAQTPSTPMSSNMVGMSGGSQPHSNIQPFLAMNWIISMFGVFPTQS
jgi:microcystin-dependent protein